MFRPKGKRIIDQARSDIAGAEMMLSHAFTDAAWDDAMDRLARAKRFLKRVCDAWSAWDNAEHDDYEDYPDVPEIEQGELILVMSVIHRVTGK